MTEQGGTTRLRWQEFTQVYERAELVPDGLVPIVLAVGVQRLEQPPWTT
jgi:hypothetical protein